MFITPLLFVGAIRLSRPHAPWARWRYTDKPRKMHRALERERVLRRPVVQAKLWLQHVIAGEPRFPDDTEVEPATRPRDPRRARASGRPRRRLAAGSDRDRPGVRYFYDTEFIDNGRTIELISIGVAAEDGREYYAISTEFDPESGRPLGAHECAAQAAVAVVAAVAVATTDPVGSRGLLRHRRRRADRAVGLGRRLRPRGAVPAVGADDQPAARDPAVHPRAAPVLGGARLPADAAAAARRPRRPRRRPAQPAAVSS